MLISKDEQQDLKELLFNYFDSWVTNGEAEKYADEGDDVFAPEHDRLEDYCDDIIYEMAEILKVGLEN